MATDVRAILEELNNGMEAIGKVKPEMMQGFGAFAGAVFGESVLDLKTKELIAIGLSVYSRCEYCIVSHVYAAFEAGCSKEELVEAAFVAVAFSGGPGAAYASTLLMQSIEEFAKDFE